MLDLLQFPFMQRALLAGLFLALLLALLGIFVILRKMSFWGDGLAHASLAGIALALLLAINPLFLAIVIAVIFALLVYYLERKTTLSSDAIIGVLFTSLMALGIILLSFKAGYQPDLISYLFGNILAIKNSDLYLMAVCTAVILYFLLKYRKQLTLITFDKESAYLAGINVNLFDLIFYIFLAVAVVLGVKILGIVLVSALLIIPASIAKLVAKSFRLINILSVIFAEIIVSLGLVISYYFNLPSGAVIILTGTLIFLVMVLAKHLKLMPE